VLKIELHAHTADDPADLIPHTARQLIDRAATLGYDAIAVTLHDLYYDVRCEEAYARAKRVVLIPGIERTIDGCHLLLLNFPAACAAVSSVEDLRALKASHPAGLVIAPHPFYPIRSAVGPHLNRWAALVDAVEVSSMFTARIDYNRRGIDWARRHGKPLVGTTDVHLLTQLGTTYTLVDAAPDPDAICAAIRCGRIELRTTPLRALRAAALFGTVTVLGLIGRGRRWWRR
jgi:predicted metal-dependent phosphoesterase TrpH